MDSVLEYVLCIATGIIVSIPVVVQLVKYVKKLAHEKQWNVLIKEMLGLMVVAEEQYEKGSVKKDFVLSMCRKLCADLNIEFDEEKVGAMIDAMVELSKQINVPKETPISSDGE